MRLCQFSIVIILLKTLEFFFVKLGKRDKNDCGALKNEKKIKLPINLLMSHFTDRQGDLPISQSQLPKVTYATFLLGLTNAVFFLPYQPL